MKDDRVEGAPATAPPPQRWLALARRVGFLPWLLALAAIAGLVAFAIFATRASREATLGSEQDKLAALSRVLAEDVRRVVFGADLHVSALQDEFERLPPSARTPEELGRRMSARAMHERLNELVAHSGDIDSLCVADAHGRLLSTSRQWPFPAIEAANMEHFAALRDNPDLPYVISLPMPDPITRQEILMLARRLDSPEGRFLGVVCATISTGRFHKLFREVAPGDDALVVLFRRDGGTQAQQPRSADAARLAALWNAVGPAAGREDAARLAYREAAAGDAARMAAFHAVPGYPLVVAVSRSEQAVLANWQGLANLIALFTLAAIMLVAVAGLAFLRLMRARAALGEAAARLADSNAELGRVNRRLTETQEYARMGQWELDLVHDRLVWSDEVHRIFEVDKDCFGATYAAFLAAVHPADRAAVDAAYTGAVRQRAPYEMSHRLLLPDGRVKHVVERGRTKYDEAGRALATIGSVQDITALKAVEEQLRVAITAAEAATRAKSAFLANMSHEIRTPMNAILGFAHILMRTAVTAEQRDKLGHILAAGDHLLALLNDVLDLSKIEAGRMVLAPAPFQLGSLIANLRSMFAERMAARGIEFRIEEPYMPNRLVGDTTRLSQALINYLGNALKFTERGSITLRMRVLEEGSDDLLMCFEVEDTGIGIPADKLGAIFQAFEQADSSMTREREGTGLGLAITRSLAGLMGGDVGVRSTPGSGSTFWVTARLGKTRAEPAAGREPQAAAVVGAGSCAGLHVLLAEDEPINQALAIEMLADLPGLLIDVADDGQAALEMAARTRYDAILMDMQMPRMNGLDATRAIRALPGYETAPILAMTGNAFAEDRQRCLDAGMTDFIAKPFTPAQLLDAVRRALAPRDA